MKIIFKFKKQNPFELMFLSLAIASISCIGLVLLLSFFALPVNIILPVVAPIWIGSTTLIFTVWKDN